jgi:hypothetical protein
MNELKEQQGKQMGFHFCLSESSIPIDCSTMPSRNYVCPGGQGTPCLDGPSMLCDIKPDCPGGDDEDEEACRELLFKIIFLRNTRKYQKIDLFHSLRKALFQNIYF